MELFNRFIFWETTNLFEATRFIQFLSWAFGFGFFDYEQLDDRKHSKIWTILRDYVFSFFWLSYFFIFMMIHLYKNQFAGLSGSPVVNNSRRTVVIFGIVLGGTILISSYLIQGKFTNILKKLLCVDRELLLLGVKIDFRREASLNLSSCALLIVFLTVMTVASIIYDECDSIERCVYNTVPMIALSYISLVFTLHLHLLFQIINSRYCYINNNLFCLSKIVSVVSYGHSDREVSPVLRLARLHDQLAGCVDDINFCFSFQFMISLGGVFCIVVSTFYNLMRTYVFGDYRQIEVTHNFLLWSTYYSFLAIKSIALSSRMMRTAKRTSTVVHQNLIECKDSKARDDLKIFSLQLTHRSPIVSCGLFVFDWTLVFSIVSAITTYLMILVQFETSVLDKTIEDQQDA